jgi:hypothetical protein
MGMGYIVGGYSGEIEDSYEIGPTITYAPEKQPEKVGLLAKIRRLFK